MAPQRPKSTATLLTTLAAALPLTLAQTPAAGSQPDDHPALTTYRCTLAGGCSPSQNYIVLDSSAHWVHQVDDTSLGCGNWGSGPNATVCPTVEACAENCVMERQGDYASAGISTTSGDSDDALTLHQIVNNSTVSPRAYLLTESRDEYEMLSLSPGTEFTFEVDVSTLPCGMNAALYLSEMEAEGGAATEEANTAGAAWGTGYCDAQCYVTPWINGVGNVEAKGVCCNEMDIWESNSRATSLAPHPCSEAGVYGCDGSECEADGVCDKNGCGWNPYRLGETQYYGRDGEGDGEFDIDTTREFTVVTQFLGDGENATELTGIKRIFLQDGVVVKEEGVGSAASARGLSGGSRKSAGFLGRRQADEDDAQVTDDYCQNEAGATKYMSLGGTAQMGDALTRGMVLAFSLWWDESSYMQWLDGAAQGAGPCDATEGSPENIVKVEADPYVVFSGLRWGEVGSTYQGNATTLMKTRR